MQGYPLFLPHFAFLRLIQNGTAELPLFQPAQRKIIRVHPPTHSTHLSFTRLVIPVPIWVVVMMCFGHHRVECLLDSMKRKKRRILRFRTYCFSSRLSPKPEVDTPHQRTWV